MNRGEAGPNTEQSLKTDFSFRKKHNLDSKTYGHDENTWSKHMDLLKMHAHAKKTHGLMASI